MDLVGAGVSSVKTPRRQLSARAGSRRLQPACRRWSGLLQIAAQGFLHFSSNGVGLLVV